jgi:hypothetical protein
MFPTLLIAVSLFVSAPAPLDPFAGISLIPAGEPGGALVLPASWIASNACPRGVCKTHHHAKGGR